MARTITIPARELSEAIRAIEEWPPATEGGPGSVTVSIGAVDEKGSWVEDFIDLLSQQ